MTLLIFTFTLFMFTAFKFKSGEARSVNADFLFHRRQLTGKDSTFREGVGVSFEREQIFALFLCSNQKEAIMPKFKTPSNELLDKLSILEIAVETSIAKLQTQHTKDSLIIRGIENAYDDFKKHLIKYISTTEIWPGNYSKLKKAQKRIGYDYNTMLNSVLSSVNIIPAKGEDICRN